MSAEELQRRPGPNIEALLEARDLEDALVGGGENEVDLQSGRGFELMLVPLRQPLRHAARLQGLAQSLRGRKEERVEGLLKLEGRWLLHVEQLLFSRSLLDLHVLDSSVFACRPRQFWFVSGMLLIADFV